MWENNEALRLTQEITRPPVPAGLFLPRQPGEAQHAIAVRESIADLR